MMTPRVSEYHHPQHASTMTSEFGPLPGPLAPDARMAASMPDLVRASLIAVPDPKPRT